MRSELYQAGRIFPILGGGNADLNQAKAFRPARFFASSGPASTEATERGKGGKTMNGLIRRKHTILVFFTAPLLASFVLFDGAVAVVPPPDGGYPGGNTAEGQNALFSLTTGGFNTAVGFFSLRSNTIGSFNTAVAAGTLLANTADNNTATGTGALLSNTTRNQNTATGGFALFNNTDGGRNTAFGFQALSNNTSNDNNTAVVGPVKIQPQCDPSGGW
jgi:hypothetical protein